MTVEIWKEDHRAVGNFTAIRETSILLAHMHAILSTLGPVLLRRGGNLVDIGYSRFLISKEMATDGS